MKCPFCAFENPNHANFCMSCGSPQNLKACEKCDTINPKDATKCHGCGTSFSSAITSAEPPLAKPEAQSPTGKQVLSDETSNLKQLLAELEEDLRQQRSHDQQPAAKLARSTSELLIKPSTNFQEAAAGTNPEAQPRIASPIVVEPPSYLQPILSEQAERRSRRTIGWRIFSVILLLALACGGIARYGVMERDNRSSKSETITSETRKDATQQSAKQAVSPSSPAELSSEESAIRN